VIASMHTEHVCNEDINQYGSTLRLDLVTGVLFLTSQSYFPISHIDGAVMRVAFILKVQILTGKNDYPDGRFS
jgi:hypothetical protein